MYAGGVHRRPRQQAQRGGREGPSIRKGTSVGRLNAKRRAAPQGQEMQGVGRPHSLGDVAQHRVEALGGVQVALEHEVAEAWGPGSGGTEKGRDGRMSRSIIMSKHHAHAGGGAGAASVGSGASQWWEWRGREPRNGTQ